MTRQSTLEILRRDRVLGVLRLDDSTDILGVLKSLQEGGLNCLEITMTTPGALDALKDAAANLDGVLLGVGTILDKEMARDAIFAGAEFLVTPTFVPGVVEMAERYNKAVILGAMTPTEILRCWREGADLVKVFPAATWGPEYIKAVRCPLPQIPLVPTGGITPDNAAEFIRCGAALVCVGSWLTNVRGTEREKRAQLVANARMARAAVG